MLPIPGHRGKLGMVVHQLIPDPEGDLVGGFPGPGLWGPMAPNLRAGVLRASAPRKAQPQLHPRGGWGAFPEPSYRLTQQPLLHTPLTRSSEGSQGPTQQSRMGRLGSLDSRDTPQVPLARHLGRGRLGRNQGMEGLVFL